MRKSWIPFLSVVSMALVLIVACIFIALRKDNSNTEAATETAQFSRGPVNTKQDLPVISSKNPEARNSTDKDHHKRFCRKCCQTPPCWYNNHKECSKCTYSENIKQDVSRLLRRSYKKAILHHHGRAQKRLEKHGTGKKL